MELNGEKKKKNLQQNHFCWLGMKIIFRVEGCGSHGSFGVFFNKKKKDLLSADGKY